MPSLVEKVVKGEAKKFNKLRAKLVDTKTNIAKMALLTKNERLNTFTKEFDCINWYYSDDETRGQRRFMVATLSDDFKAALLKSSDVGQDGFIYEIDKRDILPPDGKRGYWQFWASYTGEEFVE